ncbi:MAG: group-specific protein [Anaerolineales bacterium]|nr:group-specific protein [Anaerolineales bacterium]
MAGWFSQSPHTWREVVKAALTAYPDAVKTPGPHGISLIAHAEAGGDEAKSVLDYLNSLA